MEKPDLPELLQPEEAVDSWESQSVQPSALGWNQEHRWVVAACGSEAAKEMVG
jgi:hypothetical protein